MRTFALITLLAAALAGCEPAMVVLPSYFEEEKGTPSLPSLEEDFDTSLVEVSRNWGSFPHDQLPLDAVQLVCEFQDGTRWEASSLTSPPSRGDYGVKNPPPPSNAYAAFEGMAAPHECVGGYWVRGAYWDGESLSWYDYEETFGFTDRLSPWVVAFPADARRPSNSDCGDDGTCDGHPAFLVPTPVEECGSWADGDEMVWDEGRGALYRTELDDYYSRSDCP